MFTLPAQVCQLHEVSPVFLSLNQPSLLFIPQVLFSYFIVLLSSNWDGSCLQYTRDHLNPLYFQRRWDLEGGRKDGSRTRVFQRFQKCVYLQFLLLTFGSQWALLWRSLFLSVASQCWAPPMLTLSSSLFIPPL